MSDRTPSRVRAFLRDELPRWRAEGILDDAGVEALSRRHLAEPESTGLAVAALYVLGSGMVGAGIISLVAWHWDELARWVRLAILGVALVAAHGVGFWMWQAQGRRPRLGHAVSLLGTVIFGASIGLVAQLFHVSGPWYGLFGAWALGALAAGLVLPSLPALGLAMVLALYVWGPGFVGDHPGEADALAWLVLVGAMVLAFRSRSRALFLVATAGSAVVLATAAAVLPVPRWSEPAYVLGVLVGMTAATSAFAGYRWRGAAHPFAGAAGALGRVASYALAYWLSCEEGARGVMRYAPELGRAWFACALPPLAIAVALLALGRAPPEHWARRAAALVATLFALAFTMLAVTDAPHLALAIAANAAILAVAAIRMADGLRTRRRAPFWEGLGVAAVVACSRFVEIDTMLWLKGLAFIGCGIALTVGALVFERRLSNAQREEVHHA
jgi:hypothetical protein